MKIVKREEYLEKLRGLKDKHIIKVVTGMRRCGKSTLLETFRDELREGGVADAQIHEYNFEDLETQLDYRVLYDEIKGKLVRGKQNYVFLDEIQNVDKFEKVVDSLFVQENTDVYVTGSNAYFLSGELATYLSGRYMEIKMLPFSYKEYLEMKDGGTLDEYLEFGGMPQSVEMFEESEAMGIDYLRGVYSTVVLKDVLARNGTEDAEALERLVMFLFDNLGNLTSPNSIANFMRSDGRKMDARKVERLIKALCESLLLYPVDRYNIKGKTLLSTRQKYYLVDLGFRKMLLGATEKDDSGRLLENVVYLELLRRGNQVWVGQTRNGKEIDFVARTPEGDTEYYQVTESLIGEATKEREFGALLDIRDNRPKFILTREGWGAQQDGIKALNAEKWLLGKI